MNMNTLDTTMAIIALGIFLLLGSSILDSHKQTVRFQEEHKVWQQEQLQKEKELDREYLKSELRQEILADIRKGK